MEDFFNQPRTQKVSDSVVNLLRSEWRSICMDTFINRESYVKAQNAVIGDAGRRLNKEHDKWDCFLPDNVWHSMQQCLIEILNTHDFDAVNKEIDFNYLER